MNYNVKTKEVRVLQLASSILLVSLLLNGIEFKEWLYGMGFLGSVALVVLLVQKKKK